MLEAFGLDKSGLEGAVRVSLSGLNTEEEIEAFATALKEEIQRLKGNR